MNPDPGYWEEVLESGDSLRRQANWLRFSRELYSSWIARYLTSKPEGRVLKTDAFEESRGSEVHDALVQRFGQVVMIDLAHTVLRQSTERTQSRGCVQSSSDALPFRAQSFDAIVSLSTLDHFEDSGGIARSLRELWRVATPGAELLLTLDNGAHPLVRLRNALPHLLLARLGVSPYRYGKTMTPVELCAATSSAGWRIRECTAVVHAPRVVAVALSDYVGPDRILTFERYRTWLRACEHLSKVRSRFVTGYFVLLHAEKPAIHT